MEVMDSHKIVIMQPFYRLSQLQMKMFHLMNFSVTKKKTTTTKSLDVVNLSKDVCSSASEEPASPVPAPQSKDVNASGAVTEDRVTQAWKKGEMSRKLNSIIFYINF